MKKLLFLIILLIINSCSDRLEVTYNFKENKISTNERIIKRIRIDKLNNDRGISASINIYRKYNKKGFEKFDLDSLNVLDYNVSTCGTINKGDSVRIIVEVLGDIDTINIIWQ